MLTISQFHPHADGQTLDTAILQQALDQAAAEQTTLVLEAGTYLTGSLFLASNTHLHFEAGATLLGASELDQYREIETRVAGVEMTWPAAILNVLEAENVTIDGPGTIDGQGPIWWARYWGTDQKGGQRKVYDAKNLRWIVDYEVKRPREILLYKSQRCQVSDLTLMRSGFWNCQITYCDQIDISHLIVKENNGPSTDGIDVDSSTNVRVHHCELSCGDDCIVVKSGRDGDGHRVNRPAAHIEIDHCVVHSGYGVTIGSEVSAGVHDVHIHHMTFLNTDCGFRMKSSADRGGVIRDIVAEHLEMHNVQFPFSWLMNWHTQYNKKTMAVTPDMKPMWAAVADQIPEALQKTQVRDITVRNVTATLDADYAKEARAFDLKAFPEKPMQNIRFEDCHLAASEFGHLIAVEDLLFDKVYVSVQKANDQALEKFDTR
ncbi:glycoside hydrolase family 28 protein [Lactiplantibacillus modestisalitolerans]|uniref:Glycoside hydrolase family 28 protein n=1 Tax=Lactiplantibacillus modestisalitolerans TaxID=1457219 RepID=A0ABV5WST2_9LACO|nr:glycosyl hydrolase family 28 protein [Lactiplantibacillus modestisalitolerans]